MYALNKAQIIGHLTEDPQVRQTSSGQSVGDLNIMTKQVIKTATGEQVFFFLSQCSCVARFS